MINQELELRKIRREYNNQHRRPLSKLISNGIGMFLISFFTLVFMLILYTIIWNNIQIIHLIYQNNYLTTILLFTVLFIGLIAFNIIFNFTLAILISPGYTNDYFKYLEEGKYIYSDTSTNTKTCISQESLGYCQFCNLPKPPRAHHCSLCNRCVLKMDHHCPWINNCVGHQNHRYFLLFLLFLWTGVFFGSLTSVPMILYSVQVTSQCWVVLVLNFSLTFFLGIFKCWNWHLALRGTTSIEHWNSKLLNQQIETPDIVQSLKEIFGEFEYMYEIYLPSISKLRRNGCEQQIIYDEEQQNLTM